MSATLTWFSSGLATKTGTTRATLFTNLVTLVNSKSADANFKWQIASSSTGSPHYIVLKRKDGSVGRILLVLWTSVPGSFHTTILEQLPQVDYFYGAFFPNGNVDTPSNLTAGSGTILGDDTGCTRVWPAMSLNIYTTNHRSFYFDSPEAMFFGFQDPAGPTLYGAGAGNLVVDASDNAYATAMSWGDNSLSTFSSTSNALAWKPVSAAILAGASGASCRVVYGGVHRQFYSAYYTTGWGATVIGTDDILTDTALSRVYHVPHQLLSDQKNEGFVLKLRQIAHGPSTTGAFTPYNTTGPVVAARVFNGATTGGAGYPWFTNFKL